MHDTPPWQIDPQARWVLVRAFAEHYLWNVRGWAVDLAELPLDASKIEPRCDAWVRWHDDLDTANVTFPNPFYWEQRSDAPLTEFNAEGRAIALALKSLLPVGWTVVYENIENWFVKSDDRSEYADS